MSYMCAEGRRTLVGRLPKGSDIGEALVEIALAERIALGWFQIIGALDRVEFAEYDQERRVYRQPMTIARAMEVLQCSGNISMLNGRPFVHAHITVSVCETGTSSFPKVVGGHLCKSSVFAAEFILEAFSSPQFVRSEDPETGLKLWA